MWAAWHQKEGCATVSVTGAARAQSGLADMRAWVAYMGAAWCGEAAEAEAALAHSSQAVRYLLTGKDDCVRKATKARALPAAAHVHSAMQCLQGHRV